MNVTIIGLGLIGGSLALALRSTESYAVVGWDRDPQTAAQAVARGAVERIAPSLRDAVRDADLVIVATPGLAVRFVLEAIAPHLKPGAIVTDVASTKVQVLQWAQALLPSNVAFVGGHPMAGSERHGIANARADLLRGAVYCLTPLAGAPVDALQMLEALVRQLGARPLRIAAAAHDSYVAAVSHLPFVLSAALVQLTADDPVWPEMQQLAATGYRDMTRLAAGDPQMHRDICLTNADMIRPRLQAMARLLDQIADHLDDPQALDDLFTTAQQNRAAWLRGREPS